MNFARETCAGVGVEIIPLTLKHHKAISKYEDIPLQPDFTKYYKVEEFDGLRIYTARNEEKKIAGYQVFFLSQHPHYTSVKTATQDLLFIDPEHRGFGLSFMKWCEEQLKSDGVEIVYSIVTTRFDYSPLLKRMGYEFAEAIYSKRLR